LSSSFPNGVSSQCYKNFFQPSFTLGQNKLVRFSQANNSHSSLVSKARTEPGGAFFNFPCPAKVRQVQNCFEKSNALAYYAATEKCLWRWSFGKKVPSARPSGVRSSFASRSTFGSSGSNQIKQF